MMRKFGIGLLLIWVALLMPLGVYGQEKPPVVELVHDEPVRNVAWHPNDNRLASASGKFITIWDAKTGDLLQSIEAYAGETTAIVWSPQGDRIASLGFDSLRYPPSAIARVWDADSGTLLIELGSGMETIQWSPNGRFLLTVNDMIPDADEDIELVDERLTVISEWFSERGDLISRFSLGGESNGLTHTQNHTISALWISNYHFIAINQHGPIAIWNASEFRLADIFLEPTDSWPDRVDGTNQSAAWNPTRSLLATTSNNYDDGFHITMLNLITKEYRKLEPTDNITSLAWSPDGRWLASGHFNGEIRVWDGALIDYGVSQVFQDDDTVTSVTWSPDSAYLASGSLDGIVRIREFRVD